MIAYDRAKVVIVPRKTFTKRLLDALVAVAENDQARPVQKIKAITMALDLDKTRKKPPHKAATVAEKTLL